MSDDDDSLICPITQEIFRDPVIAEDGRLYEREAITRWINENGTSPFTRQVLNVNHLQPDEHSRKRADRRRRLSVTYNREADQVELPPIRSPRNIHFDNTIVNTEYPRGPTHRNAGYPDIRRGYPNRPIRRDGCRESIRNTCPTGCSWRHPKVIACICMTICVLTPSLVTVIVRSTLQKTRPTFTSRTYQTSPPACYALNYTSTTNTCIASFANVTYIKSGTCNDFTYQRNRYNFIAVSSRTTIIFAFQQTIGFWDIDDITLWDYNNNQYIFQNGGFESSTLSPGYNQCQSLGYISNSSQFNGRYCYSDRTNEQFGYLMQNVSVTVGSHYSLEFYLQNRNGLGSSYMVLLGT